MANWRNSLLREGWNGFCFYRKLEYLQCFATIYWINTKPIYCKYVYCPKHSFCSYVKWLKYTVCTMYIPPKLQLFPMFFLSLYVCSEFVILPAVALLELHWSFIEPIRCIIVLFSLLWSLQWPAYFLVHFDFSCAELLFILCKYVIFPQQKQFLPCPTTKVMSLLIFCLNFC